MPERSVVNLKNCSFRIAANIAVGNEGVRGVIACQGGNMAGWSLYLDDAGCPVYHYNWMGHNHYVARSAVPLTPGTHEVVIDFVYDGGFGAGGDAVLLVDGEAVAHVRVERTVPIIFSMSGESFDIGMDTGAPVGNYPHVYRFTGEIHGVTLERLNEPNPEIAARIAEGEFRASIATQ
jgi:arylsulfatase